MPLIHFLNTAKQISKMIKYVNTKLCQTKYKIFHLGTTHMWHPVRLCFYFSGNFPYKISRPSLGQTLRFDTIFDMPNWVTLVRILKWNGTLAQLLSYNFYKAFWQTHGRQKVHERIRWADQPGPNGQLSCLHSFKIFSPLKPSYTSNEMTYFAAHFDVSKNIYDNFENVLLSKPD